MKKFLKERRIKDIMCKKIISAQANTPVKKIIDLFTANKVMSIPVLDKDDRLMGLITQKDIDLRFESVDAPLSINLLGSVLYLDDLDIFNQELKKKLGQFAVDIMTTPAISINEGASLEDVLKLMDDNNIFRVPVVDDQEKLVGMITNTDIIKELIKEGKKI